MPKAAANLRHAYLQLSEGCVAIKHQRQFADGLISPVIKFLEEIMRKELTQDQIETTILTSLKKHPTNGKEIQW